MTQSTDPGKPWTRALPSGTASYWVQARPTLPHRVPVDVLPCFAVIGGDPSETKRNSGWLRLANRPFFLRRQETVSVLLFAGELESTPGGGGDAIEREQVINSRNAMVMVYGKLRTVDRQNV